MHRSNTNACRVTVSLFEDAEVVAHGVHDICSHDPRLRSIAPTCQGEPATRIDVALVDPTLRGRFEPGRGHWLQGHHSVGRLVAFSWDADPAHVAAALRAGFAGWLSKDLPPEELTDALVRIAEGERVVELAPGAPQERLRVVADGPPVELTQREEDVLGLITHGFSNEQIAAHLYLSINSVKSYIRTAYRKIGAESRSKALLWALEHGLGSERVTPDAGAA